LYVYISIKYIHVNETHSLISIFVTIYSNTRCISLTNCQPQFGIMCFSVKAWYFILNTNLCNAIKTLSTKSKFFYIYFNLIRLQYLQTAVFHLKVLMDFRLKITNIYLTLLISLLLIKLVYKPENVFFS